MHQRNGRDLDHGFRRDDTADGCAGDPFVEQTADHFIRKAAELINTHRTGDYDIRDAIEPIGSADDRVLGVVRQGADCIKRILHVLFRLGHVPVGFEFQRHTRRPFGRTGAGSGDPFDSQQGRFKDLNDGIIDVFGTSTRPLNGHRHRVDDDIGKILSPHFR